MFSYQMLINKSLVFRKRVKSKVKDLSPSMMRMIIVVQMIMMMKMMMKMKRIVTSRVALLLLSLRTSQ